MIGAVVLAGGHSRRMGQPKINLAWGETTVLGQIVQVLAKTPVGEIVIVTGPVAALPQPGWERLALRQISISQAEPGEMLDTFQMGLKQISPQAEAALVVLGDQPQIEVDVVRALLRAFEADQPALLIPSYRQRRGHPWLVRQDLFGQLFALRAPSTLRDFLQQHAGLIRYLVVDTESVLQDLDTPQDYDRFRPASKS